MISQKTRSTLTLVVGTILVLFGTVIIVALSSGYSFNLFSGELTSTGLVKLASNPSGATIKINSKTLRQKTPYQLENVKIGPIDVEYTRQGYYDWKSSYSVVGGEVTFADYALLIQKEISQQTIESQLQFSSLFSSLNNNRLFASSNLESTIYEVQRNSTIKQLAELPLNESLKKPNKLSNFITNTDGSSVILTAAYPDSPPVRFYVDPGSGASVNIDALIGFDSASLVINPRNNKEIYFIQKGQLSRLNVDSKLVAKLSIQNVSNYSIDKDNIYCLENLNPATNGQFLVRYSLAGSDRYVLAQYGPTTKPWQIVLSNLDIQKYIALLDTDTDSLYVLLEKDNKVETSKLGGGVSLPRFNYSGRFLSYMQSGSLRTVDIEYLDRFERNIDGIAAINWLTDFQIILNRTDGTYIVDYNGYNIVKLPQNIDPKTDPVSTSLVRDTKSIYYISAGKILHYSLQPNVGLINFR